LSDDSPKIYRTYSRPYFQELKTRPRTAADDCADVRRWMSKEWVNPEMVTREEIHSAEWFETDKASTAALGLVSQAKTSEELVGDIHSDAQRWLEEVRARANSEINKEFGLERPLRGIPVSFKIT